MNYVRTHRFDDPQDTLPRPLVQPMTIAQAERAYRSPLFMRAQCSPNYQLFRGRA